MMKKFVALFLAILTLTALFIPSAMVGETCRKAVQHI